MSVPTIHGRPLRPATGRLIGAMALLAAAIFLLDCWTPPSVDLPILYVFVALLAIRSPQPLAPVMAAAGTILLTLAPPILIWTPADPFLVINRLITSAALMLIAVLVSARRAADARLRESRQELEQRVEDRTAELRAANRALESEMATRRAAEQSLSESRERLNRTEDFSLVMVTHLGLDGRWLKVPEPLCQLLGYAEAELLALTLMNVTHPEDVEAEWSQCQRLIRGDIKSFELETRCIRKEGGLAWVYLNCSGVYDGGGRLVHFLAYLRDITDQKRIEDALRRSEEKWRSVIETVPIGIAISTVSGRVLDVNTAAWKILGYDSKQEFLAQAAVAHYVDPADRSRRIDRIRSGDQVFETQYRKKDGTLFWGRCTAAILGEQDGEPLLINAYEDITDQRAYRETLRQAKEELQAANRRLLERDEVRTKFISVVSHELRTPMAAIKGFIDNMLNGVTGGLNERQTDYLSRMQSSLDRLTRLIGQLLDWSGLEIGAVPLLLKPLSAPDVVHSVVGHLKAVAETKQVRLITRMEEDLPAIQADRDKIEQVLWNLIGNAIKFSRPSGTVTVECRAAQEGGLLFTVSDTGCGIQPADLPKVFDQFSGIQAPTPAAKGAQLGLYITKSLVLRHGGTIWVESVFGEGSRFFAHVPEKPPAPQRP